MDLRAQTPSVHKEGAVFTVYAVGESPAWDQLYYLTGPKEAVKLAFVENGRSAPHAVADTTKPLVFAVERTDPETKSKTYVPVAEARWPEKASTVLCVFAVERMAPTKLRVVACDDGLDAFPLRSVRVFNALDVPVLGRVVDRKDSFPPGISQAYAYPVTSIDPNRIGSFPLAFGVREQSGNIKLLYSGYGDAWPTGRSLVFVQLAPEIGPDAVQVSTLVDVPPAPRTKSAP